MIPFHTNNNFKSINSHKNHLKNPQTNITIMSTKQKYMINAKIAKIIIKKFTFFSQCIRMSGNSINFDEKNQNK